GALAVFGDLQGSKETVCFTQRGGQTLLILLESGQLSEGQMRPSQFTLGLKSGEQLEGSLQMFPGFCEIALRASTPSQGALRQAHAKAVLDVAAHVQAAPGHGLRLYQVAVQEIGFAQARRSPPFTLGEAKGAIAFDN